MEVASDSREKLSRTKRKERGGSSPGMGDIAVFAAVIELALFQCPALRAQIAPAGQHPPVSQSQTRPMEENEPDASSQQEGEAELQAGTILTRKGLFKEAIPHLLAARGRVTNEYAADFNLALCYVGSSQFKLAIDVLNGLRSRGHDGVDVGNLLAQAYIGNAQPQEAMASLERAANLAPQNEKLYVFVADAFMDHQDYSLGLKAVEIGLVNLPKSARLHYERALFLAQLDELDQAKPDFEMASQLAAGSEIGYLAAARERLLVGDIPEAVRTAREGVKKGYENPALLTLLGEALIRSGATPGQPDFVEAQTVLQKAVAKQPNDPTSQLALGGLYLMAGRLEDAITHLEIARQIEPGKASVYANLARAYQRAGELSEAQVAMARLAEINQEQAEKIRSAPGDRKAAYSNIEEK
ncbi:MAG: tetratricopeptide repeat protein [Candidatus Sulfotelmatobacter sp.]